MHKPGDKVIYGLHGVCEICNIEIRTVDKMRREYYVLQPLGDRGDRFYVPMDNEAALSKLRPLLTKQQLENIFSDEYAENDYWIENENQRRQRYREIINSGDRTAVVGLVRALNCHKSQQLAQGRKFHLSDENFLRDALKLLSSEISYVLQLSHGETTEYINKIFQK